MLRIALKIAPAIDAYAKKWRVDLNDDYLSPDDWELLQKIMSFLQPFYRATMETQGHNATIDLVLWTMDILVDHFETSMALYASNTWLCNRISKSWEVFDKYYNKTDETSVYAMAIILHPARRTHYIRKFWKKQWQKPALLGAKKLWEKYRDKDVLDLAAVIQMILFQTSIPLNLTSSIELRNLASWLAIRLAMSMKHTSKRSLSRFQALP